MTSVGRSLKPASFLVRGTRPGHKRTNSNSSLSSISSTRSSHSEPDQFVFSPGPTNEKPLARISTSTPAPDGTLSTAAQSNMNSDRPQTLLTVPTQSPSPTRTRPIEIELPTQFRRISTAPVYTPDAPLSGRGDLPGGYFPLHEDPEKRVHRPHPFHADTKVARRESLNLAAESSLSPRSAMLASIPMSNSAQGQLPRMVNSVEMSGIRGNTPVTSYAPSGTHHSPTPVGKYYPSNYENRYSKSHNLRQQKQQQQRRPPTSSPATSTSENQVPTYTKTDPRHSRTESEAKRQIQQYQRDMVAQATMAARQIVARNGGASSLAASVGMHGIPASKFQLKGHKPTSPRLTPLGSPGPVTPMELEGAGLSGDGGYMTRGVAVPTADAGIEGRRMNRALRAEAERQRKEGGGSPAVEAGGYGF